MKKSKRNSQTSLSVEQKEKRANRISTSAKMYQDEIGKVILFFSGLGLRITFVPEFNFKDKWRFDYYSPELGLAIEFEGGRGHVHPNRYQGDLEKYNRAVIYGYPHLLRFIVDTLDQVKPQVYQFYRQRSKHLGGLLRSERIEKMNEEMFERQGSKFELRDIL